MVDQVQRHIRDFIYLDVPRLYSFYSQVFEGLTERLVDERIIEAITSETAAAGRGTEANSEAREASRRSESIVLHDHMYNRLEGQLDQALVNANDIGPDDFAEQLDNNPFVKVTGYAEIEDYSKMVEFMRHFNRLTESIAYANLVDDEHTNNILELIDKIENETQSSQKKVLEQKLKGLTNAREQARQQKLLQDPKLLENLEFISEQYKPSGYDITITPHGRPIMHYRGVLDRSGLRYSPDMLVSLYGGRAPSGLTMVGTITHLPELRNPQEPEAIPEKQRLPERTPEERAKNPMLLDQYRGLFRSMRTFERFALESETHNEIVLSPLAIYKEYEVTIPRAE